MADEQQQGKRKTRKNEKVGQVVSAKMTKTIVVEVTRRVPHPVYKRIINKRNKFYAHDEQQTAKLGDVVRILECRPMSKLKRWELGEVIRKAVQVAVDPGAVDVEAIQVTSGAKSGTRGGAKSGARGGAKKGSTGGRKQK
ncbi:MAG TPA: 30S ribosomal protein S17 [Bryobacteraceae bacterium]|nr:30S ribosomal protein S17 [Bryobacteraceae bacterium]